jgi:transcriptional regulator with XRE-family HTH domain
MRLIGRAKKGALDLKQHEIAKRVGVTQGYISQIVNGLRQPPWDIAKSIASITKTNVDLWYDGSEQEKREAIKGA